jgi:MFS transporter, putative metabolite:H+ symporter
LSLILCTLVMASAALVFFTVPSASWTLAAIVVFGIAGGFYLPLLTTYGSEIFPTTVRAAATTTAWAVNRVGAALVPLLLLPLFAKWGAVAAARAIYLSLGLTLALFIAFGSRGAAGRAVD